MVRIDSKSLFVCDINKKFYPAISVDFWVLGTMIINVMPFSPYPPLSECTKPHYNRQRNATKMVHWTKLYPHAFIYLPVYLFQVQNSNNQLHSWNFWNSKNIPPSPKKCTPQIYSHNVYDQSALWQCYTHNSKTTKWHKKILYWCFISP